MIGNRVVGVVATMTVLAGVALGQGAEATQGGEEATSRPRNAGTPKIMLSETSWDFGEITYGDVAQHVFKVTNEGAGDLELGKIKGSCACTVPEKNVKRLLAPGESTEIKVNFNSKKKQGPIHTVVWIESNDPASPKVEFNVRGHVKTLIDVEPLTGVMIRSLDRTKTVSGSAKIINRTAQPITPVIKSTAGTSIEVGLKEIEAGKVYELVATTKPPLPFGRTSASVQIETGMEKMPVLSINVIADMQELVEARPAAVLKRPEAKDTSEHTISLRYFGSDPEFKVTEVTSTAACITATAGAAEKKNPSAPVRQGAPTVRMSVEVPIKVLVGPGSELPPEGAKVVVKTTDKDYPQVEILVTADKVEYQKVLSQRTGMPGDIQIGPRERGSKIDPNDPGIENLKKLAEQMQAEKEARKKAKLAAKQGQTPTTGPVGTPEQNSDEEHEHEVGHDEPADHESPE